MSPPPSRPDAGLRIAVIGSGVAGLTAAHLLGPRHQVTLYEAEPRPGGHTHTVIVDRGPDAGLAVDTGFIVMNLRNYPVFSGLLHNLGVALQASDMSFSYHDEATGFHYAGGSGPGGLFAQPVNLLRPSFVGMLVDIVRFNRRARADLAAGRVGERSLADYVGGLGLSRAFRDHYLLPMGAAIWSTPFDRTGDFPALAFLRFFENHGLLTLTDQPTWRTVAGGSRTYVDALLGRFPGAVRLGSPVRSVRRDDTGVTVEAEGAGPARYDRVVIAAHADQALAMLADPGEEERRLLGAWEYSSNRVLLHTDTAVLPPSRAAWASWNYRLERDVDGSAPVSVSYYMNRLQRLRAERHYVVTLNPRGPIRDEHVIREMVYTHPRYTLRSMATQPELSKLNGRRHTWFCGSYFGWGFHEDAVVSGASVARGLGVMA